MKKIAICSVLILTIWINGHAQETNSTLVAIDAAIKSLRSTPNQFNLNVMNVGMVANGVSISAQGGGPGSTTIGAIASANGQNVQITQDATNKYLIQESTKAIALLQDIRSELISQKIDKKDLSSKLNEFTHTYVAPVLKDVIAALVLREIGLK